MGSFGGNPVLAKSLVPAGAAGLALRSLNEGHDLPMTRKHSPRVARPMTRQLDDMLAAVELPPVPRSGWIASIRQALGMSKTQLAKRVGVTRPSLDELESNEVRETITLASLHKVADALGCDLKYVLVPRKSLGKQ